MSLNASAELIAKANSNTMSFEDFIECIKTSLPDAWSIVEKLATNIKSSSDDMQVDAPQHMEDSVRGQLLRMMASSSMHQAIEQYFGLKFEFQNCHNLAGFKPSVVGSKKYQEFISANAQILAQQPHLKDC